MFFSFHYVWAGYGKSGRLIKGNPNDLMFFFISFTYLYYNVKSKLFWFLVDLIILHHISWSHNFTPHYFNIYFLIEFIFYSIIKHLIRILTHYIFFNRNNILFHIYKHNHIRILTHYIFFNRNNILFHIYKHNHNQCLIL